MRRYIIISGLILFAILLTTNCSKQVKIGFLMDNSKDGRWPKDKELFIKHANEIGAKVLFRAAEGDSDNQLKQAKELLAEDIDILVLIPTNQHEAAKIVLEAHRNNIRVISYDRLVRDCHLDFYVSFDHVNVGEIQAQYITSACPQGNYAIIGGAKTDNNAYLLRLGQLNILQPYVDKGDIKIIYDNYVDIWTPAEGFRLMSDCLKKQKDIDAVIAANDRLAGGVIKALKEHNITKPVFIAGMDADLDACQRVFAGTQTMTVYKPIEAIAVKAAEMALQIAQENKVPTVNLSVNNGTKQVPAILLPAMVVNKETIDLTVIADGYLEANNIKTSK